VLRTARATVLTELRDTIIHQPIELGSCSKLLQIQQSLLVQMENFFFILGDVIMGTCFRPCGQVYLALGANPMGHFFGSIFFLESRLSYQSLELLIGLLAYLEPKLWLKIQNLLKILSPQKLTWDMFHPGHNSPAD